ATATDNTGTYAADPFAIAVRNVAPTVTIGGAASVNEGATYTLSLSATGDPGQDTISKWVIKWGDGSATQTVSGNPSSAAHTYADGPNGYTVSATATDEDGTYSSNTKAVTVNNVAPTILTATNLSGGEGKALSFSGTFSDPGVLDTHTASITWGDGTSGSGKVTESGGSGSVAADHYYADNGTYTITFRVTDKDGGYHEVT